MRNRLSPVLLLFLLCLPLAAQKHAPAALLPAPAIDAAYVEKEFGPSFKLDPTIAPLFADLFGEGREDLILVANSPSPLISESACNYRVEDPYSRYFGTGDAKITAQFGLHFDGSSRTILIVLGWRQAPTKESAKQLRKFVLINTPFETLSIANLRVKKKQMQAIETVDRTTLHSLVFWDGHHWRWSAQGMAGDDTLFKMPSEN